MTPKNKEQLLEEQHSKQELFNDEAEVVHINSSLKLRFVEDKEVEEIEDIARKRISDLQEKSCGTQE